MARMPYYLPPCPHCSRRVESYIEWCTAISGPPRQSLTSLEPDSWRLEPCGHIVYGAETHNGHFLYFLTKPRDYATPSVPGGIPHFGRGPAQVHG
jgi:hypothetical protein